MTHPLKTVLLLLLAFVLCGAGAPDAHAGRADPAAISDIRPEALPAEARDTLRLIERGGPFPYRRDGIEFQNRERRLPLQPRGYYREYTVPTPGERSRGARRIISGQAREYFYTPDHYRSFQRILR